jgi:hypothetical protein
MMLRRLGHWRSRDLRFAGLIGLTGLVIALYLNAGLRLADREGSGWRTLDLDALMQRIETGELRDREAQWYHPSTDRETRGVPGMQ